MGPFHSTPDLGFPLPPTYTYLLPTLLPLPTLVPLPPTYPYLLRPTHLQLLPTLPRYPYLLPTSTSSYLPLRAT